MSSYLSDFDIHSRHTATNRVQSSETDTFLQNATVLTGLFVVKPFVSPQYAMAHNSMIDNSVPKASAVSAVAAASIFPTTDQIGTQMSNASTSVAAARCRATD